MSEIVYLNGEYINKDDAKISPDDRGFIFADGVYEVIKYYNGNPFRYEDHIQRLDRSLKEISITGFETAGLNQIFERLLKLNALMDEHAGVYLQVTRGVHKRVHHFPENLAPTVYIFVYSLPSFTENQENGIKVITHEDIRWLRCDIKSVSLLPNTMIYNKAVKAGAKEAILIRDGIVTEATHSSFFGVKNGIVITHPLSNLILPGITRKVVFEICNKLGIKVDERCFDRNELFEFDEAFISGTGSEITPVTRIDDVVIGKGMPGNISNRLKDSFFSMV
jgi:D-alanine transaminase